MHKILVKRPGEGPQPILVEDFSLKRVAALFGDEQAYVEQVRIGAPDAAILCDEDGMGKELADNCGMLGTIVFVGLKMDPEEGEEWDGLNDEAARKCVAWCLEHINDRHPRSGIQIYTGDEATTKLAEACEAASERKKEWKDL